MNGRLKSNNFLREKHAMNGEQLLDLETFILLPRKKKKEKIYEKIKNIIGMNKKWDLKYIAEIDCI